MEKLSGLLLITDHVCSMDQDRVNFEDRVLNEIRASGCASRILVRRIGCHDAGDALRRIRDKEFALLNFKSRCSSVIAYVLIGNTEKTRGGNRFWFSQFLMTIAEELNSIGILVCFVYTKIKDGHKNRYTIEREKKICNLDVYKVKSSNSWQQVSLKELQSFCSENDATLLEHYLHCPHNWETPTKELILINY